MLNNIPTHLIGGPLGAGKTSLIRQLLAQRPAHERWAVLVNEFGQIGLDAALLASDADGVALGEVAGGCLCCVNGVPFQVGLGRLLRKARPQRLLIEPSGLGHPLQLLEQLRQPPWAGVLAVQPAPLVLDAAALAAGQPLAASQQAALEVAGLLLLNKAEGLDAAARAGSSPACRSDRCAGPARPRWRWRSCRVMPARRRGASICRPCPNRARRHRASGARRRRRSARSRRRPKAGASAGPGTPASASPGKGCSSGSRAWPGAAPSWCCTPTPAGWRPMPWTVRPCTGRPAPGAGTRAWS
ncbi:cobalamin biosynthesis protein CobW [Pseudomonas lalucatii]|uniref:Cobalamin biosynthesis protein CobW n=1 Tax=Pseudomonas lalucatii TaxID=1424203 RepID=A0ABS5Q312_9PSED|nr:cobalamin biosynthesis protein CobW [Pseudomonas lalucatii]